MSSFLLLLLAASATVICEASPHDASNHHGDGHDNKCVDISTYGNVTYKSDIIKICSYMILRTCSKKSKNVCIPLTSAKCDVLAYADCTTIPSLSTHRDDTTINETFIPHKCVQEGVETLEETKQKAVCHNETKTVCDSKWEINDAGKKVWTGDENCRDLVWEDCELQPYSVVTEIPTYKCHKDTPITFVQPVIMEASVKTKSKTCEPKGVPECSNVVNNGCVVAEWEDCEETVVEKCVDTQSRVPQQEFDHRLKCIGGEH